MPVTPERPGLRERKKLRTRAAIRRATLRLVTEQGYEATTIEQIAAAAEVSPSTVVRYFPVKEDILLTEAQDTLLEARLLARPPGEEPLESLRAVVVEAVTTALTHEPAETRLRARLLTEVPAIRARLTETTAESARRLSRAVAQRTGRDPDDLEVRVFTAAVLGALREATLHWAEHGRGDDLIALLDRTVDILKAGLTLRPPGPARP